MSSSKDPSNQCDVWSSMEMEAFELMILGILVIFLAYKIVMKICGKDSILAKRREAKLQKDAWRFEKFKIRFQKAGEVEIDAEKEKEETKGPATVSNEGPVGIPLKPFVCTP